MTHEEFLARLEHKASGSGQWSAKCPAHEDKRHSLCVGTGADGRILVHCQAGCSLDEVLNAIGVEKKDLYQGELDKPRVVSTYDYRDANGNLVYQVVRFIPKDFRCRRPDGRGGWSWSVKGVERVLYRLPEVLESNRGVVVVEGEKDADRLTAEGFTSTTVAGGAGKAPPKSMLEPLRGRTVAIIPDNDTPGRTWATQIRDRLSGIASECAIVELDDLPDKGDVSDWFNAGGTREQLREMIRGSIASARPDSAVDTIVKALHPFDCGTRAEILDKVEGMLKESRT
jgi:5S rRNA maturation endonuclease (ribonuclease M5)